MKVMRLLTIALALIVLATGCQQATSTAKAPEVDKTFAIYTFSDAVTGAKIDLATGDTATIQYKASGAKPVTLTGTENDNGVIDFANDQVIVYNFEKADQFILTVTKTGYKAFEGRALFPGTKGISNNKVNEDGTSDIIFYSSVLYPSTIPFTTQALNFNVRNNNTKALITTGGSYVVYLSGAITTNGGSALGVTAGTNVLPQFIPPETTLGANSGKYQGYTISGTIPATGVINIPAGSLFSGLTYNIDVKGVAGYTSSIGSVSFTDGVAASTSLNIDLVPAYGTAAESSNSLNLIATNNVTTAGQAIKGVRAIALTFDRPIDVNTTLMNGMRLSNLISIQSNPDTDNDGNTTNLGVTSAPGATAQPSGLTVSASGATLTITIAATDADLTTGATVTAGTLDTDDMLTWNLNAIYTRIQVRPTDATNATSFQFLSAVGSSIKTVNGGNVLVTDTDQIVVR